MYRILSYRLGGWEWPKNIRVSHAYTVTLYQCVEMYRLESTTGRVQECVCVTLQDLGDCKIKEVCVCASALECVGHGQRARFKRPFNHKNTGCTTENLDNLSLVMFVKWSVETYQSYLFRQVSD